MVYDNAEVFEVGQNQKMPEDGLDVIGGHTRHPDVASITARPARRGPNDVLPSARGPTSSHRTHENYGATMDASTEDRGFHDLGWIACSLTIADPSVVTLYTASSAPSRPSLAYTVRAGALAARTQQSSSSRTACAIVSQSVVGDNQASRVCVLSTR
ncbi:hypothetical protein MVEN_00762900 [Mycena venus]|uniref:Uncharacterized protein n=1 Tax=Mycena venus TaxID=2733690 RepID=A0A8H6YL83_9AGAR|nr:hypothetical protein MVEN_00762900 [Mycena venus]